MGRQFSNENTHACGRLGFLVTFTLGGISGMFFPVAGLDVHFHDSYFVVAHFHYVFIGGTVFGLLSGVYYWYPKVTGRKLNEKLGLWHFLIGFLIIQCRILANAQTRNNGHAKKNSFLHR